LIIEDKEVIYDLKTFFYISWLMKLLLQSLPVDLKYSLDIKERSAKRDHVTDHFSKLRHIGWFNDIFVRTSLQTDLSESF